MNPGGRKILLIDDEPLSVEFLSLFLQDKGYNVQGALSCAEAYSLLTTEIFDIVITDIELGDGNGLAVIKFAKEKNPNGRFIGITGYDAHMLAGSEVSDAAFSCIMTKPVDLNQLYIELSHLYDIRPVPSRIVAILILSLFLT